jgi:gamma-glutamylcyclotransferase
MSSTFLNLEPPYLPSASTSRSPSPSSRYEGVLIFAYGSNLWHHQVFRRCPSAKFIGVGRLRHWSWHINECGHANVSEVAATTPYDSATVAWLGPLGAGQRESNERVYGMVYNMSEQDEALLDGYQDVPASYTKQWQWIEMWPRHEGQVGKADLSKRARRVKVAFYADREHTKKSPTACIPELAYKIQQGVLDAVDQGIPSRYIDECIRPYLPPVQDTAQQIKSAIQYAVAHGVDVRKLIEQVEDELIETSAKNQSQQKTWKKESFEILVRGMAPDNKQPPAGDEQSGRQNRFASNC